METSSTTSKYHQQKGGNDKTKTFVFVYIGKEIFDINAWRIANPDSPFAIVEGQSRYFVIEDDNNILRGGFVVRLALQ